MSDGPKKGAKWSKYSVEDGNWLGMQNFVQIQGAVQVYFWQFMQIANLAESVVTLR